MADVSVIYEDEAAPHLRAAVFEAAPEPIMLLDHRGQVLHANRAAQRALAPNPALAGRSIFAIAAADHHPALRDAIAAAAAAKGCRLEICTRAEDASPIWWECSFYPLDTSRPVPVVMSCRDITASRHRDVGLQGQARILRAIAEAAPLAEILDACCSLAEQTIEGSRCRVLLPDDPAGAGADAAASGLPPELFSALHTLPAGRAADRRSPSPTFSLVVTAERGGAAAPDGWQSPPGGQGLATCWSLPLRTGPSTGPTTGATTGTSSGTAIGGTIAGAFATCFQPPRPPSDAELERAWQCADLASLALAQHHARQALAGSETRFRAAAEEAPGFLFVTDPAGRPTYVNPFYQQRTGRAAEDLMHGGRLETIHPEDRALCAGLWATALANGAGLEASYRIRMADGAYRWCLERALPQRGQDGAITGWVGVAVDIEELIAGRDVIQRYRAELETLVTERTRALEAAATELHAEMSRREQAMAALSHQHKVDALGQLTAGVAHDFNNLLATIMGGFQLIESRTQDAGLLALTRNGLRASERAASLVRQLLSVARREPPRPEWLDLSVALPGVEDLLRHALHPGITLSVEVPRDVWPVFVDAPQLESALLNLVVNARDAMPGGGRLTISAANQRARPDHAASHSLGATQSQDRDHVVVTVADTGAGIPAHLLERVVEPFFTTKPRGEGTGLGLAMVKGFVEAAAGELSVQSTVGAGTRIALHLPRATNPIALPRIAPAANSAVAGELTALVVDDDEAVRAITCAFLKEAGYRVLEAGSGAVALALLQVSSPVDVLVSDVLMPAMDGLQLAHAVRAARPGLPVVLMTGYAHEHDLTAEIVVQKPFSSDELKQAVARALGRPAQGAARPDRLLTRMRSSLIREAYMTWQALRGDDTLPRFGALTVAGRAWAENAFLLAVDRQEDPTRFRWISVGQALARHLPHLPSAAVGDSPRTDALLGPLEQIYLGCVADGMPHYQAVEIGLEASHSAPGERLLMPVTSEAGGVTHLLGIIAFDEAA